MKETSEYEIKARGMVFGLKRLIDEAESKIQEAVEREDWSDAATRTAYRNGLSIAFEIAKLQFADCL